MKKFKFRLTNKQWMIAVIAGIIFLVRLFVDQITKAAAEASQIDQRKYFL